MFKRLKNQKGFTLIELIAVMAILGILALVIVPKVSNYGKNANVTRAKADLATVKNAIERYNAEHDIALTDDDTLGSYNVKSALTTKKEDGYGPYIDKIPDEWSAKTIKQIMEGNPSKVDIKDSVAFFEQ